MSNSTRQSEHAARAVYLALHGEPMTDAERRQYDQQRAAEMARAEARREASPQMELPTSA